ncbi:MAG: DUF4411 family protein [Candidatus Sericytochromatia bacterium]|nr:DUF4411 family protein [Candidatus Sericytochromatia bacterium]
MCPGFWSGLLNQHQAQRVFGLDRNKLEMLKGNDGLVKWIKEEVPLTFFLNSQSQQVITAYQQVMVWSQAHPQYTDAAKSEFAAVADSWMVAYAMAHNCKVVTNEQPSPESKKRILIPDACNQFGVQYTSPFEMLRTLSIQFQ